MFDENSNWYVDENINEYVTGDIGSLDNLKATFDFWESNLKATINGYVFGNVPGLTMNSGDEVVWYLIQVGGFTEMHTVHFHGQSVLYVSNRVFKIDSELNISTRHSNYHHIAINNK